MTGTARPRRSAAGLALGVTVAVVAVVATPLLLRDAGGASAPAQTSPSTSPATTPTAAASMTSSPSPSAPVSASTLLADGRTVEASGRIVSVPGKPVRLCAPVPMAAMAYAGGHEPAPAWCPLGVDVTGVDLRTLQETRTKDGATEGYGYVRGVYRNGTVSVSVQSGQRASVTTYPTLTTPPCPLPAGGWHRETRGSNPVMADRVSAYSQHHPGQVEALAIFRPNGTTGVVVAAVKDLAAARAALPDDPGSLCLIASTYSGAQVTAARAPFEAAQSAAGSSNGAQVVSVGQGVGPSGQSELDVQVVAMTAQVAQWAAAAPAGLVSVVPWLSVVAPDAPLPASAPTGPPTVSPASAALYASEDAAFPSATPSKHG